MTTNIKLSAWTHPATSELRLYVNGGGVSAPPGQRARRSLGGTIPPRIRTQMKRYTVKRAGPYGAIRVYSTNDLKTAEAEAHNWAGWIYDNLTGEVYAPSISVWIRNRAQADRLLEAVRGR